MDSGIDCPWTGEISFALSRDQFTGHRQLYCDISQYMDIFPLSMKHLSNSTNWMNSPNFMTKKRKKKHNCSRSKYYLYLLNFIFIPSCTTESVKIKEVITAFHVFYPNLIAGAHAVVF